jgi:regulator of sirC expression with transglutaminase-like and TPR domain
MVLVERRGYEGDRHEYGDPANSMLDQVLVRGIGLPITLSIVYIEAARRADVKLAAVGLPGHFVVGHFGAAPPLLLDPFNRGEVMRVDPPIEHVRAWSVHEVATRMLNNLVNSYSERGDLARALRAAELRLMLPASDAERAQQEVERTALLARLN